MVYITELKMFLKLMKLLIYLKTVQDGMDCSGETNTFHETYSNFLYLYNITGSANEIEIIATRNKNVN